MILISSLSTQSLFNSLFRTFSSMTFLLPDARIFGDTVIMELYGKNYTARDLPEIFDLIDDPIGKKMWMQTKDTFAAYDFPER